MIVAASSGISLLGYVGVIFGAASSSFAWLWSSTGKRQLDLLKIGNEEYARRITQLETEVTDSKLLNEKLRAQLDQSNERLKALERIVTSADAIAALERSSQQRHDEVMAAIGRGTK